MEDLLFIEEKLAKSVEKEREKREERRRESEQLDAEISSCEHNLAALLTKKSSILSTLGLKTERLHTLRSQISEERERKRSSHRSTLLSQYSSCIEQCRLCTCTALDKNTSDQWKLLEECHSRAVELKFPRLSARIKSFRHSQLAAFVLGVKEDLNTQRVDRVIEKVRYLAKVVDSSSSPSSATLTYVDIYFRSVADGFNYHFMSSTETNRLDKPEWYLCHLEAKIREHQKIFFIIDRASKARVSMHNLNKEFFKKVFVLINEKIRLTLASDSRQKIPLILHHVEEIRNVQERLKEFEMAQHFAMSGDSKREITAILLGHIDGLLKELFRKEYTEWMEEIHRLIEEVSSYSLILLPYIENIKNNVLQNLVSRIVSAVSAFLRYFDYQKREEFLILLYFLNELPNLEKDLLEIEHDITLETNTPVVIDIEPLQRFKEEFADVLSSLIKDRIARALSHTLSYKYSSDLTEEIIPLSEEITEIKKDLSASQFFTAKPIILHSVNTFLEQLGKKADPSDQSKITGLINYAHEILKDSGVCPSNL